MNDGAHICELNVESSLNELRSYIQRIGAGVLESGIPLIGTMPGFEDDQRELHQIPACLDLAQRVVETGLISLFKVNHPDELDYMPAGLGALQLYAMANGLIVDQKAEVDMGDFWECLISANERCDMLIGNQEIVFPVVEGQSRVPAFNRFWGRN